MVCWTNSSFTIYNSLYTYIYVYFDKVNYLQRQRLLTLSWEKLHTSAKRHLKSFYFVLEKMKCQFNFTNEINFTKLPIIELIVTYKWNFHILHTWSIIIIDIVFLHSLFSVFSMNCFYIPSISLVTLILWGEPGR